MEKQAKQEAKNTPEKVKVTIKKVIRLREPIGTNSATVNYYIKDTSVFPMDSLRISREFNKRFIKQRDSLLEPYK